MPKPTRIPLIGPYNTRVSENNSSATSTGIVGLGVVGTMIVGNGIQPSDKDQRFVNCYATTVKNPSTQSATAYLVKRPGWATHTTPSAGNIGNQVYVWTGSSGEVISTFGATTSTIYNGTTSLGTITGACTGITETDISGTANLAFSSDDNTGWYFPLAGSLTQITDVDFPGNAGSDLAGTFAHLDGYAFIMDTTGRIYDSDVNSLANWTAATYRTANLYADAGVGCFAYRSHIIAFCSEHYEVWYNAGNQAASPLERRDEACRKIGLVNANAVALVDDSLGFVGTSGLGSIGVYLLDGFNPVRVSTPTIDAQLVLTSTSNVFLSGCKIAGLTFLVLVIASSTYVYCVEEQLWHEWTSTVPLWHRLAGHASGGTYLTYAVSRSSTTGKVFVINPSNFVFTDNGTSYSAIYQSSLLDFGTTARKTMDELVVLSDIASTTSTLNISFSDDDYETWSTARSVDLSTSRPKITRCGSFRRRAIKLSHSVNVAMRIQAIDAVVRAGNN